MIAAMDIACSRCSVGALFASCPRATLIQVKGQSLQSKTRFSVPGSI
jgi:hypothetical protein